MSPVKSTLFSPSSEETAVTDLDASRTWMTGWSRVKKLGAVLSAESILEVVAPPINSGTLKPALDILTPSQRQFSWFVGHGWDLVTVSYTIIRFRWWVGIVGVIQTNLVPWIYLSTNLVPWMYLSRPTVLRRWKYQVCWPSCLVLIWQSKMKTNRCPPRVLNQLKRDCHHWPCSMADQVLGTWKRCSRRLTLTNGWRWRRFSNDVIKQFIFGITAGMTLHGCATAMFRWCLRWCGHEHALVHHS